MPGAGVGAHTGGMSASDYIINIALVGLVLLQIRGRRLTSRSLLLPLVLVGIAALEYLHGVPSGGNGLLLAVAGALVGAVLGTLCGLFTSVRPTGDGAVVAKAGALAAVLWVAGVGSRLAFELYVTHGGQAAVGRFSLSHGIKPIAEAWTACLVLMALAEVLGRTGVLAWRSSAVRRAGAPLSAVTGTPVA